MDVKSIKLELVQNILDTQEEGILEQIRLIFDSSNRDWWDVISDDNKRTIEDGMTQLDRGEGIPNDEAQKRIKEQIQSKNG